MQPKPRLHNELVRGAKALARQFGTSLLQLVASPFRVLTQPPGEAPDEELLPPLTRSLKGRLRGVEADEEEYYAYLERKHR